MHTISANKIELAQAPRMNGWPRHPGPNNHTTSREIRPNSPCRVRRSRDVNGLHNHDLPPPTIRTKVLSSVSPRSDAEGTSPAGGGGGTAESKGSVFSFPGPGAASPWHRSGGERSAAVEELAWVSVTDVKPSHWYNVRHRFSWRVGGVSSLEGVEEVRFLRDGLDEDVPAQRAW